MIYEELATEIVNDEFDYLTGSEFSGEVLYISGWLSGHLGDLNILINTCFSGVSGEIDPVLEEEEEAIYKQLYMSNYYKRKVRDTLRGIDSSVDWQSIQEGDSKITRTNKNEVAKSWKSMANSANEELDKLISKYTIYEASPVQVFDYEA